MNSQIRFVLVSATLLSAALSACHDSSNDDTPAMAKYEVSFVNLTAGEPLSPMALVAHDSQYMAFETGKAASVAVEKIAEGGDNSMLLADAMADASHVWQAKSGSGIVAPGKMETLMLEVPATQVANLRLSLLSMLANTNDGFVALNGQSIGNLQSGQSTSFDLPAYEAGTEANTETADTVLGPAATGGKREGFNPARDDLNNRISLHPGIISKDDGLISSVLTQLHRWDNPAARINIRRVQ